MPICSTSGRCSIRGPYAVSMARQFGSIDLNASARRHDAVFFVAAGSLIHYSARLAIPLAILVTMLVFGVIWIGIRDGRFSISGVAAGFRDLHDRIRSLRSSKRADSGG